MARRYGISRDAQDAYALQSQLRTAAAQRDGLFDAEIVPLTTQQLIKDKHTGEVSYREVTLAQDEGNRPQTRLDDLSGLKPVLDGGCITAGNASQLSDGASACVLMDARLAEQRNLQPIGLYRGIAVAGLAPEEMGIGPVYAVPRLLRQHGLKVSDIGLWELNEAFASQGLAVLRELGVADDAPQVNPNGGAIALGHPLGMSGARLVLTALHQLEKRGGRKGLATMCVGVGQGLALAIERV